MPLTKTYQKILKSSTLIIKRRERSVVLMVRNEVEKQIIAIAMSAAGKSKKITCQVTENGTMGSL